MKKPGEKNVKEKTFQNTSWNNKIYIANKYRTAILKKIKLKRPFSDQFKQKKQNKRWKEKQKEKDLWNLRGK